MTWRPSLSPSAITLILSVAVLLSLTLPTASSLPLDDTCGENGVEGCVKQSVDAHDYRKDTRLYASRSDGVFRIVMMSDLHFDEEPSSWGPEQDVNTTKVMNTVLDMEATDLVILNGDQITSWRDNATDYWDLLTAPLRDRNRTYGVSFGNHDDLLTLKKPYTPPNDLTRRYILLEHEMKIPQSRTSSFFASQQGGGISNYYFELSLKEDQRHHDDNNVDDDVDEEEEEEEDVIDIDTIDDAPPPPPPKAIVWVLDSGGGSIYDIVRPDQVEWMASSHQHLLDKYNITYIPSILFQHIPTPEVATITPKNGVKGCTGVQRDGINPTKENTGVAELALKMRISHIFTGHNHGNTFCCPMWNQQKTHAVQLCYSGHTGYGGYGNWMRSGRVIELDLHTAQANPPPTSLRMSDEKSDDKEGVPLHSIASSSSRPFVKTYYRMEDGSVVEQI